MATRKKLVLALTEASVGVQYEENGVRGLVETYDIQEIRKTEGPIPFKATIVVAIEREVALDAEEHGTTDGE